MVISETLSLLKNRIDAYYVAKQAIISVKGPDASTFLTRLATNNLSGNFTQTSFTNNKGRMIDHCLVFSQKDEVILASSHEDANILLSWLNQYHFVEDIHIKDASGKHQLRYGIGQLEQLPDVFPIWSCPRHIIFASLLPLEGQAMAKNVWESLRIMCLMPKSPNEINENVMPQNINLTDFIDEKKGCYIGQEVIAKALTYQKHVKKLCGLKVDQKTFELLKIGLRVTNTLGHNGELTSVAPDYVEGEINALLISDCTEKRGAIYDLVIDTQFIKKS